MTYEEIIKRCDEADAVMTRGMSSAYSALKRAHGAKNPVWKETWTQVADVILEAGFTFREKLIADLIQEADDCEAEMALEKTV